MSTPTGSVISAPRLGDAFPADENDQSQIKTRRMNMDSEKPFDPSESEPKRRIQQPKEEPKPPKETGEAEEKPEVKAKPEPKAEPKPEKKKAVEEDLKDPATANFAKRLFGDRFAERLSKGPEEKPDAKKPAPTAKKPAPAAKAAPAAEPEKKPGVTVTKQRAGFSSDDIRTIAETAATAAVSASRATAKEDTDRRTAEDDPTKDLAPEDRRNYEIATYLGKANEKYASLPAQMLEAAKLKREYKEQWLRDNAGEKFSWDDDAHTDFLERISPEFDENDFEDARIEMRAEKVADRRLESADKRIRELEQQTVGVSLKDSIERESRRALKDFAEEIAPEADWDLGSEEGAAAVAEKEDILGEIVTTHAEWLKDATTEAVRFYDSGGKVTPEKGNKLHNWMIDTVDAYEQRLTQEPDESRRNAKGQTFVTRSEYYKLPEAKRARHWTIGRDQVIWIMKTEITARAKNKRDEAVARQKRIAEARGMEFDEESIVTLRKSAEAAAADKSARKKTPVESDESNDDDTPPSSGDGDKLDTSGAQGNKSSSSLAKRITDKIFQRAADKS